MRPRRRAAVWPILFSKPTRAGTVAASSPRYRPVPGGIPKPQPPHFLSDAAAAPIQTREDVHGENRARAHQRQR